MSGPPVEVSPDDVHAHPRKTGHAKFDLVMAISAIFISAVSLFVAIEHGKTERDLVAANSWPFLRQILSNVHAGSKGLISIGLSNGGVGPAVIKSFEMSYEGSPVSSPLDLLQRCCELSSEPDAIKRQMPAGFLTSLVDDTVLRPGEDNVVLQIQTATAPEISQRLNAALLKIGFRACYCSILDQCWESDLKSTRTTQVKECKLPQHPYDAIAPARGRMP